jgi:hypothetical protein
MFTKFQIYGIIGRNYIKEWEMFNMNGNKFLKLSLVFSLILSIFLGSSNIAKADSGVSALPGKDSPLHEYYYKLYAPKSQTTFKAFSTASQPVSKILKESNELIIYGGILTGGGALAAPIKSIEKVPYVGLGIKYVAAVGGAMSIVGGVSYLSFNDFKKGSVVKHKTYFKWTNTARLEYAVKIESWVEYKGLKVTGVKTTNFSKSL